jgi:hypothetical protein
LPTIQIRPTPILSAVVKVSSARYDTSVAKVY